MANFLIGKSQSLLETANINACQLNPAYNSACKVYERMLTDATDFINNNAPVYLLQFSKYSYQNGVSTHYDNSSNVYYLSAYYIPKKPSESPNIQTISNYIYSSALRYILITEGWRIVGGTPRDQYFTLNIRRNGISY